MATKTIPQLTQAASLQSSDFVLVAQGTATRKATVSQIIATASSISLAGLTDVSITLPHDNDLLTYDSSNSMWKPRALGDASAQVIVDGGNF